MRDYPEDFEKAYKRMLQTAMQHEEARRYDMAAKEYKHAAELLISCADCQEPEEKKAIDKSIDRLIGIAEKMKRKASESEKTDHSGTEEDEVIFLPTAEHPNVHFEDIAGLKEAKQIVENEILFPRRYPDVYERFRQDANGGILLYGLPGTGKTMLAKAIATEINADFFPIRCSDMVGKWFGEAEKRVNALFKAAHSSGNAIIFFDEFDALGAKRGGNSTVMNRLVPELLTQMDGFSETKGRLTVIAATNLPWLLDSAFIRRFSHRICVPLPDDEARQYMFRHMLKDIPAKEEIDIAMLSEKTDGFTCADIKSLINFATRYPIHRQIQDNVPAFLTEGDIIKALQVCSSSVQEKDVKTLEKWKTASLRGD